MRIKRTRQEVRRALLIWAAVYLVAAFSTAILFTLDARPADPGARLLFSALKIGGIVISAFSGYAVLLGFVVYVTAEFPEDRRGY